MELIFIYSAFVKGDHTYFSIESSGVDGNQLYPDVKYTTVNLSISLISSHQEMEKAAISLVAAAASPILKWLSNKALSYFGGDITEEELRNLKGVILSKFQTVITIVDNINIMELKPWVMNLRTAVYEAEDVMDMYEYNLLQAQVSPPPANCLEKTYHESKKFFAREFFAPVTLKTELKKSLEKLKKVADEADKVFGSLIARHIPSPTGQSLTPNNSPGPLIARRSASPIVQSLTPNDCPVLRNVFGRHEECKSIVDMLISEGDGPSNISESRIPILAIWGIGGSGKTTLAQLIFNDPRIERHFGLRLCAEVSHQLDTLKKNLGPLQYRLKKHLESRKSNKRFLLVLDDVWLDKTKNRRRLDRLLIPFNKVGGNGSRILVTTRAKRTAQLMGAKPIIAIKELEFEHFWYIIKQQAFGNSHEIIRDRELVKIGDQIVNKLKNSPLAAKLVGIQLGMQVDVNPWRMILEGDILSETRNDLLWSYKKLPQHLQQCFSFCSLFPQGWIFDKSKLVRLWIAQGFVVIPNRSKLTMEDKGIEYFNDLLSFSLFQHHPQNFDEYVIHDLLHDLAEHVSQDHCFRIEDDMRGIIPPTVIHLSINVTNKLVVDIPKILELVNLRTFFIISISKFDFINIFLDASKMFRTFKKLRILHLGDNSMPELHSSVCELKHVRYLQLCRVRMLPESLGQLYHLYFLVLENAHVEIMPKSLGNLINLKHLDAYQNHKIFEVPELGKLTSLQRLEAYDASGRSQCGIDQLKNLRELRGSLRIGKLQNVESKAEACEAMLRDKECLDQLALQWDIDAERNDQLVAAEVLEGLEPHCKLKELEIRSYIGAKSPKWLKNNQRPLSLEALKLFDCCNLRILPPLGQLPFLCTLHIRNAKAVEEIGPKFYRSGRDCNSSFPSLKVLKLEGMQRWERWHGAEGDLLHPLLEELVIEDCPKLMEMPSLPPTLRKLQIRNCPSLLQLPPFPCSLEEVDIKGPMGVSTLVIPHDQGSAPHPYSLSSLTLRGCSSLTSLVQGHHLAALQSPRSLVLAHQWTALQSLCIDDCENLCSLVGLGFLPSLQHLEILNCAFLPLGCLALLSAVESIHIRNSYAFSMPPRCLLGLTSLVELRIEGCPNLQSLSDLSGLRSLKILEVVACPEFTSIGNLNCLTCLERLKVMKCPKLTRGRGGGGGERDGMVSSSLIRHVEVDETLLLSVLLQKKALNLLGELIIEGSSEEDIEFPKNLGSLSSLQFLHIFFCPNLKSLPNVVNLTSLEKLYISNCPQIELLLNLDKLSSLQILQIWDCNEIRLIPNLDEFSSLVILDIASCPQIASLPNLGKLSSLQRLKIVDCAAIGSLPNLDKLSSLERLHLSNCPQIESLPDLEKLSSLKQLQLLDFPQVRSLPSLPSSLERLSISNCHPELSKKYGMGGPLRHELRHIPTIGGVDLEYVVVSDDTACRCWPLCLLG